MKVLLPVNNSVPAEKVIPPDTVQLFLPLYLKHPAAVKLRSAGLFMCGISESTPGFRLRRTADFLLVIFTLSGEGEMTVDGECSQLEAGSFYLAPMNREHCYRQVGRDRWRFLWFHLRPVSSYLQHPPADPVCGHGCDGRRLEEAMRGFASETIRAMQSLVSADEQPPWTFYCDSMTLAESVDAFHLLADDDSNLNADRLAELYAELILGLLERNFQSLLARYDGDDRSDLLDRLWNKVLADLGRAWLLGEMAVIAGMSVPTLIRQVRRRYDATPMQMLYHLRLKRAVQLLLASRLPVAAIAREIGYDNVSSFSTAFRKEYNATPRDYRRKFLSDSE